MTLKRCDGARFAVALASAFLLLGLAQPGPSRAAEVTVRILESFDPSEVTVPAGTTVTWVNESGNRHRVRSTSGPAEFDSGDLEPGESYSITVTAVGTYDYIDDRNKDDSAYWARLIVTDEAPTSAPTATPPPAPGATPTPAPTTARVGMAGEVFRPATVSIAPGGSVTWTNDDDRSHTVSSTSNAFDSGSLAPGQTYRRSFPAAGTFPYLCLIHPKMTGTVIVAAPGTTPPPPAPTPVPTPTLAPTPVTTPSPGTIRAIDFAFQPATLTVAAGSRISFANAGTAPHTMTAVDGSFDSGVVSGGGRWGHTFSVPGTFGFLCSLHPQMVGTIRVTDSSGQAPAPAPTPGPTATLPRPTAPPGTTTAAIRDFAFEPDTITVSVGSKVRWVNEGLAPHTVTDRGGSFDSGILATGTAWSYTFVRSGTFMFWCVIHPDMTGHVVVTGSADEAAAPTASAAGGADPSPMAPAPGPSVGAVAGGISPGGGGGDVGGGAGATATVAGAGDSIGASPLGVVLTIGLSGTAVILYLRTIDEALRWRTVVDASPPADSLPD